MAPAARGPAAGFRLVRRGGEASAAEVRAAGDVIAAALAAAGVRSGAIVAHQFDLDAEGAVALVGIAAAGAVLAPLHPGWTPVERDTFLSRLRPSVALAGTNAAWPASGWTAEPLSVPGFGPLTLRRRTSPEVGDLGAEPDREGGAILATSGTDGAPRLVVHGWPSLMANAVAANERVPSGPDDRWLATLAWAHVGGLAVPLRAAAAGAAVGLASPRFDAATVARALAELAITHVSLVPAMLHRLLRRRRPAAGLPARGPARRRGDPANPARPCPRGRLADRPYLRPHRGGVPSRHGHPGRGPRRRALVRPSPARRRGPHPTRRGRRDERTESRRSARVPGRPASGPPHGLPVPGHIEVRGPTLFHGYLGAPAHPRGDWFSTGDLGRLDADGRLHVTGRLRDRIVSGGANVDPHQVEAVLAAHPEVREVAVIGLPDETWGQIVTAVIVPRRPDPAPSDARLAPRRAAPAVPAPGFIPRLTEWCRERLSGSRLPRRWELVERLPRTVTGKVDRERLRTLVHEREPLIAD